MKLTLLLTFMVLITASCSDKTGRYVIDGHCDKSLDGDTVSLAYSNDGAFLIGFSTAVVTDGKFKFVIGEGISKKGPIPPTGNTNTRAFFEPTTKEFIKKWVMEGPTHHYALGVGHKAEVIKKIADILDIPAVIVK